MIWASVCWNASTSPVRSNCHDTDNNDDSQHSLGSLGIPPMSAASGLGDAHVGPHSSSQQLAPSLLAGVDAVALPLTKVTVEDANLLLSLHCSRNSSRASTETQPPNMLLSRAADPSSPSSLSVAVDSLGVPLNSNTSQPPYTAAWTSFRAPSPPSLSDDVESSGVSSAAVSLSPINTPQSQPRRSTPALLRVSPDSAVVPAQSFSSPHLLHDATDSSTSAVSVSAGKCLLVSSCSPIIVGASLSCPSSPAVSGSIMISP